MTIQDFPPSVKPLWGIVTRETLAIVASSLLLPFGRMGSPRRTKRTKEQRTVVFVHGYLANGSSFLPLRTYLLTRGIKSTLQFNYPAGIGIEQAAYELKAFLRAQVRGGRVDLVCHSLGGVIASVYIQMLGGARRIDRCIMLGSPLRGTYNAYWVPSRVGTALRPDSVLLTRLEASRAMAAKVQYTSIVAGADNIVIPRVFAAGHADMVHIPDIGHQSLLFSPTAFRAVAERLMPHTKVSS